MKLTDKTLALLVEGDPAEVEVLHFVRSPPMPAGPQQFASVSSPGLPEPRATRSADDRRRRAGGLRNALWIDLSCNRLETLAGSGLDAFAALGLLDVSQRRASTPSRPLAR